MPDASGETPEAIAYTLMQDVMRAEDTATHRGENRTRADRAYLLDLYAECLLAAIGKRAVMRGSRPVGVASL